MSRAEKAPPFVRNRLLSFALFIQKCVWRR
nr:MAG TPA: hypothetical protein [Caudoviricetes sp.]